MAFRGRQSEDRGSGRGRSGGRFKYTPRTQEQVRKRQEQGGGGESFLSGDHPRFSPQKGDNTIRVLPPTWEDADHFGYDIHVHYGVGADNSAYLCPLKMNNEPCPICEERAEANASGDEDYARQLAPSHRVLYWLIDREKEAEGPMIWAAPYKSVDREISAQVRDSRTNEVLNIDDPEEGYDVEFMKEGEKDRTKYTGVRISRHSSDLGRKADEWLEVVQENPLPGLLVMRDYDTIESAFKGSARRKSKDDDKAAPARGSSSRNRAVEDDNEDTAELPSADEVEAMGYDELLELAEELGIDTEEYEKSQSDDLYDEVVDFVRKAQRSGKGGAAKTAKGKPWEAEEEDEEEAVAPKSRLREMRGKPEQVPSRRGRR